MARFMGYDKGFGGQQQNVTLLDQACMDKNQ